MHSASLSFSLRCGSIASVAACTRARCPGASLAHADACCWRTRGLEAVMPRALHLLSRSGGDCSFLQRRRLCDTFSTPLPAGVPCANSRAGALRRLCHATRGEHCQWCMPCDAHAHTAPPGMGAEPARERHEPRSHHLPVYHCLQTSTPIYTPGSTPAATYYVGCRDQPVLTVSKTAETNAATVLLANQASIKPQCSGARAHLLEPLQAVSRARCHHVGRHMIHACPSRPQVSSSLPVLNIDARDISLTALRVTQGHIKPLTIDGRGETSNAALTIWVN